MGLIRNWLRRRILARTSIPGALWEEVVAELPLLDGLTAPEMARLRDLTTLFLHEKQFDRVQDADLDEFGQVRIAVQACLPILNLGLDWYRGFSAIILYPDQFLARREEVDDAGVIHHRREPLSGEAWEQGGIILSLADVEASGWCDGYNVVIHEMAHKLDMLNGEADGFPPLHRNMRPQDWHSTFVAAYDDLGARADAGEEVAIDPYAAESPAECFAVFSEYFFELPGLLTATYPEVYAHLGSFYRQDPAARQAANGPPLPG